jgi:glycosyltransferase involved in cell wall biosynthesis
VLSPKVVRYLDHVILMSSEQKDFFAGKYPDEEISVILHGIDTDYYRPAPGEKDENVFKCVTVGQWLRDYETLQNVAESLQDHPSIEFHVVSSVNLGKNLRNVIVHRNISDDALLNLYQRAALLFMPLKDATANNAIMEGMACGLPVLTSDLPSTREYLKNSAALLVSHSDVDIFRNHILDLAHNREKCIAYGESSRQWALELSWPLTAKKYETLYLHLMGNGK